MRVLRGLGANWGEIPSSDTTQPACVLIFRRAFYDQRIAAEVDGGALGDEYRGYIFRIAGGNDKQGFPMAQGVLVSGRVRLLMSKGSTYYRPRKKGERKRKSVRGCIVGPDLSVLNLVVVKKGDADIAGLTDAESAKPRRLGPKRASNIRKLFVSVANSTRT